MAGWMLLVQFKRNSIHCMNISIPSTLGDLSWDHWWCSASCLMPLPALVTLQILSTEQSPGLAAFTVVRQYFQQLWSCNPLPCNTINLYEVAVSLKWKTRWCPLAAADWCNFLYFGHPWTLIMKLEVVQNAAVRQSTVPGSVMKCSLAFAFWAGFPTSVRLSQMNRGIKQHKTWRSDFTVLALLF